MKLLKIFRRKSTKESVPVPSIKIAPPEKSVDPEEDTNYNRMKKVNIKALEGNSMKPGKVYAVSQGSADFLVKNGRAVLAKDSEKVGKVYNYPKTEKKSDLTD